MQYNSEIFLNILKKNNKILNNRIKMFILKKKEI